mmetsp:Transcript_19761/g.38695  ORF Transcript_19761/g.38695 Transcript_19761/m.38695 type:complete len:451 (+) Transcript_19761:112-1464(+)
MVWGQQRRGVDDLVAKLRANETGPALLVMSTRSVDDAGLKSLAEALADNNSLQELLCSGHSVSEDAARSIGAALRKNRTLKRLSVGCQKFGDSELLAMLESWDNSTLEAIDLELKSLSPAGMAALGTVLGSSSHGLQDIRVGRNSLGDDGIRELASGIRDGPVFLKNLELNSSGVGVEGCKALGEALRKSSAKEGALRLVLSDNPAVGDLGVIALVGSQDDVEDLAEELSGILPSVEELHMDGCGVGAAGFASICTSTKDQTSRFHAMKTLALGRNEIDSIDNEAALACVQQLEDVDLRSNKIGLDGFRTFASALKAASSPRLQTLNLTSIGITMEPVGNDDFKTAVEDALAGKTLKELRLMGNALGDEGVAIILEALRHDDTLETLGLGGVNLTRAGAEALAEPLKDNKGLRTLELGGNDLGDGSTLVEILQAAKPNLIVALDGQKQNA